MKLEGYAFRNSREAFVALVAFSRTSLGAITI